MIQHSKAKKNKHQHIEDITSDPYYLYADLPLIQKTHRKLSSEEKAMLDDDIYALRRHFKRSNRRLKRTIHYENWVKHVPQKERPYKISQLRVRHVQGSI